MATVVAPAPRGGGAAWDQVASGELAFDFTVRTPATRSPNLDWSAREKVGVKEAIIRWLEEQL